MTVLSDIHTRIRSVIGKGTSVDTSIVSAVRAAARKIEQNRTYQYMKRYGTVTMDLASDLPYVIDTPNEFKRIRLIQLVFEGSNYRVKRGLDVENLSRETGVPTRYELDGTTRQVFNTTPDVAYTFNIWFDSVTSWPTADSATNWLITNGEEALVMEALIGMAVDLRDPRQRANLQTSRDEAYRSLLIADEELSDSDYDPAMTFTPEGGLYVERETA